MVIDPATSRLYIGGMNHLYDLTSDSLAVRVHTITGPHDDSESCRGGKNDSCNEPKRPFNSNTKALAVYDKSSKLIECTSLFQGRCRLRNLHNISEALAESENPIIANDEESTVVVFVGSGPKDRSVLYVASTFVKAKNERAQSYREDIPAVASLALGKSDKNKEFDKEEITLTAGTYINLNARYRDKYKIDYVGGFEAGDFAYFATRQRTRVNEEQGYSVLESKLVRVCAKDRNFFSYTEVSLECRDRDVDYNLLTDIYVGKAGYDLAKSLDILESEQVVYGVFQMGDQNSSRREVPTTDSALCVFPMRDVEKLFQENVLDCFKGNKHKGLEWMNRNDNCVSTKLPWNQMKCGNDVNKYIGGVYPIKSQPVLKHHSRFTAVAVNTTHGTTIAFVGTDDGRLIKIAIQSKEKAFVYDELHVSLNEPILQDLEFTDTGKYVYALTPTKVIRVPASDCGALSTHCGGCLSKKDPYCGWCDLKNQCTEQANCGNSTVTNLGWLDYQNNLCPNIKSVVPAQIQVTTADYINVTLENVGESKGRLRCQFKFFGSNGQTVDVEKPKHYDALDGTLRCATPPFNRIPVIPPNQSHINATLAITPEGRLAPIATTNFTFYDCGRYTSCSECTRSAFPCDWCLEANECVDGKLTEDKCRKQHFVNGISRKGQSSRQGPNHCPYIKAPHGKIFVAAGERKNITVKISNLDPTYMTDFRCTFRIGTMMHDKIARLEGEEAVVCDEMRFDQSELSMKDGTAPVDFQVVWSSTISEISHSFDNVNGTAVEVYRCEELASNCGLCLSLDPSKFDCGWCGKDSKCVRPRACKWRKPSDWLNSTQLCPHPTVASFSPKKGPNSGRTRIRVIGSNLGRSFMDLNGVVMVANVPCLVGKMDFISSSEFFCTTGQAPVPLSKGEVVIRLQNSDNFYAVTRDQFAYVEGKVEGIQPNEGPQWGGTDVVLSGNDLDAGSEMLIKFGESPCTVLSRNATHARCRTSTVQSDPSMQGISQTDVNVTVFVDQAPLKVHNYARFKYSPNPQTQRVTPEHSIIAGGITVDVEGSGFRLLQRPAMLLYADGRAPQTGPPCVIDSDSLMLCKTPSFPETTRRPTVSHPIIASYAFNFDGNPTEKHQFKIYPNPNISKFSQTRFYRPGEDSLSINAIDVKGIAFERDIQITVGGVLCNLNGIGKDALTCRPPNVKPAVGGGVQPEVIVKIGDESYPVGELSYDSQSVSSAIIGVIVFITIIMALCLICVCIMYRRKTTSHQRQMKYLKHQMDSIEMKVATECKEAFAELQTSLNAYTAELPLGSSMVPFLDFREYAARVLFPNTHKHPVLRELEVDSARAMAVENALREFHRLILNKTFLLTWIRVMESNKYFLGKDRVYVGSLLMVVLQEKMGYCTEILKQLLKELIERTVEKKFQPKILFRRSESVAERMLAAWFTFLMHKHLMAYSESAGRKLYELYWGIKQQMEKGPQDALTLEARYSLSEEKLLRATFDFRDGYPQPDVPVRVLDCDTITQVKEKCIEAKFRAVPYSERPKAEDLDLEWRTGINGRILLQDVDSTSRVEAGGWKKLNTLAHYQVQNNAVVALLTRQSSLYNLSLLSERSEKSTMSLKNSPTLSRPFGTSSSSYSRDHDGHHKLYHLVKPSEHGPGENPEKMVTEIYLTRLLMMKGTLQKFINDLLEAIFSTGGRTGGLPTCIKYMFDFMDDQAQENGITDPEVVHAWKSNALPLRFWVNLIKNPHFLFDIPKPTKVEGCLSVVAQTLMDACSTQDHQLTKDSPSSKLLFAKDMYQYREQVDSYYNEIQRMDPLSDQEMQSLLAEESRQHKGKFYVFSALNELYKYLDQYRDGLLEALEHNEQAQAARLPARLQDMLAMMESQHVPDYDGSTLGHQYNSASRLMGRH
ncbi:unnamed protein product, partial [Mesorhabditis belari]|uniref:Sema domain-containing protein n=1 Tax=Mesorhabditis belari TaxID=2138241 RepID=A0AAF3FLM2_9BILA